MVARHWDWDTPSCSAHFGWRAVARDRGLEPGVLPGLPPGTAALAARPPRPDIDRGEEDIDGAASPPLSPVPAWITVVHILFMAWTVLNAHYPALFLGGFLFFLGFARATAAYQSRIDLRAPLLVGFFLAGLVIHGGLQAWWIAPVLSSLTEHGLFFGATVLTAFNDNALITYLATLVPNLGDA